MTMNNIDNPFLTHGYESPEYFCDRQAETSELRASLCNGNNVTLMSPRRYGKTGLIHNVFHKIKQETPEMECFYIDIFATRNLQDFVQLLGKNIIGKLDTPKQKAEGFVQAFFRNTQLTLGIDPLSGMPQMGLSFLPQQTVSTLDQIFAYIAQSKRKCYVAIDEFQQVGDYPEENVEELLRGYVDRVQNVRFIFSGSKLHVMDLMFSSPKHPFYRSTTKMYLNVLDEQVYYDFAVRHLAVKNIELPRDVFDMMYRMVDGVTWYVQAMLNRIYRMENCCVAAEDVMHCVKTILASEEEGYKNMFRTLTNGQANLLKAIAHEGVVREITAGNFLRAHNLKSASSIQRAAEYLVNEEYVYRDEIGYKIYDRFFGMWLNL